MRYLTNILHAIIKKQLALSFCIALVTPSLLVANEQNATEVQPSQSHLLQTSKDKCDCKYSPDEWEFIQSAHVVFGEVKEVTHHKDDLASAVFIEMDVFKGDAGYIKKVVGNSKEIENCKRILIPGYYLVFSKKSQNAVLNTCAPTRRLKQGKDIVKTLTAIHGFSEKYVHHTSKENTNNLKLENKTSINENLEDNQANIESGESKEVATDTKPKRQKNTNPDLLKFDLIDWVLSFFNKKT